MERRPRQHSSLFTGSIAALLGVKDEVELIGPSINHLRRIGVDHITVADYGSTDGTLDIVDTETRAHHDVTLVHVDPAVVVDYASASRSDLAMLQQTGADWVLILDADEFWLPVSGSLRECVTLQTADVVAVDRFNVAVGADQVWPPPADLLPVRYHRLPLLTRRVPRFRQFVEAHPLEPFVTIAPGPKVMGRRAVAQGIAPGGHDIIADPAVARRAVAADLIVAHAAFSTWPRFERKVRNIRDELRVHPRLFDGDYAWHWKRWAEMTAPGALEAEFERQLATPAREEQWRRQGFLRTAADVFTARLGQRDEAQAPFAWQPVPQVAPDVAAAVTR